MLSQLLSLAKRRHAPTIIGHTTEKGVPVYTIVFSNLLGLLALLNYTAGGGQVFTYLGLLGSLLQPMFSWSSFQDSLLLFHLSKWSTLLQLCCNCDVCAVVYFPEDI